MITRRPPPTSRQSYSGCHGSEWGFLGQYHCSQYAGRSFELHQFAVPFAIRRWAIEGAGNHFITAFVSQLLEQSERVYSIPPSLTSQYRSAPRTEEE